MKKILKYILYSFSTVYLKTLGLILYTGARRYASFHTKLMHYRDWLFSNKEPSNYKHEINLYNWIYNPSQVEFAEGGIFGRMLIHKDDNVLDICCGDGSYSYLFFSDISKRVDAIDYDREAIAYADKNYSKSNINFICHDLLKYSFKKNFYDVIIWRSGSAYFTKKNRKKIFLDIYHSLKTNGKVYIGTPLMEEESFSANQIEVILNEKSFENEFIDLFEIVFKQKTFYSARNNINYILKKKRNEK